MKTIEEIRRDNLTVLIDEAGSTLALADRYGCGEAYIKQLQKSYRDSDTGRPRTVGSETARKLESCMGKTRGWMDNDHQAAIYAQANNVTRLCLGESTMPDYLSNLRKIADTMAPEGRTILLYEAKKIAAAYPASKANSGN